MSKIDKEIAWWMKQALKCKSDAWLIAFGVAVGLALAKEHHV